MRWLWILALTVSTAWAQVELEGHEDYITSLAWAPDGTKIVSGALDKSARLWTIADRSFKKYETDRGSGFSVAVSPDGKYGASGDFHFMIKLWSMADGALVADLEGSTDKGYQVRAVAFTNDSKTLVAGLASGEIWLYDVATKKKTGEIKGHGNAIDYLAMAPDGVRMAAMSMQTLKIWNLPEKKEIARLGADGTEARCAAWSKDGQQLAVGSGNGFLRLWDVAAAKEINKVQIGLGDVRAVDWSPDGAWIAVPGDGWDATLIDVATFKPVKAIKGLGENARAVKFSPDGKTLAIGWYYNVRLAPLTLAEPLGAK